MESSASPPFGPTAQTNEWAMRGGKKVSCGDGKSERDGNRGEVVKVVKGSKLERREAGSSEAVYREGMLGRLWWRRPWGMMP